MDGRTPPNGVASVKTTGGTTVYSSAYSLTSAGPTKTGQPEWKSTDTTAMSVWVQQNAQNNASYTVAATSPDPTPSIGWGATVTNDTVTAKSNDGTVNIAEKTGALSVTIANPPASGTNVKLTFVSPKSITLPSTTATVTIPASGPATFTPFTDPLPFSLGWSVQASYDVTDGQGKTTTVTSDTKTFDVTADPTSVTNTFP
jgi:hypothetical protein